MLEERLQNFFNKHRETLSDAALGNEEDENFMLADMHDEFAEEFPHCEVDVDTQNNELLVYDAISEVEYTIGIS